MTEQSILKAFDQQMSTEERQLMDGLDTPAKVQAFLDEIPYPGGEENRSTLEVLRQRRAHCLDGGLFAAAALRRQGFPARILDLQPEEGMDDDHVLALYRRDGCWGAVAKSNYSGLRFREAIFRSLHELVVSYFENFFNTDGVKTLRYHTGVIHLKQYDHLNWMGSAQGVDAIEQMLKTVKVKPLMMPAQIERISPVDHRSYQAGTLGLNPDGVYKPKKD